MLSFLKKTVDFENFTYMAMNFMWTIKGEKVSKGRALQKLPSLTEFQASP